jgi:CheY-like chemotaxis protein
MDNSPNPGPLKELTNSRARFIAELAERLVVLRQGLARLSAAPEHATELNAVRRRLHALAAGAEVLRFTSAAEALASAEGSLSATPEGLPSLAARERVARVLDLLPSLVVGLSVDLSEELDGNDPRSRREPLSVLVYGDASLEALLHQPGPLQRAETHQTSDPEQLLELVTRLRPDSVLLDAELRQAAELVPRLRQAAGPRDVPLIVVSPFEPHEPLLRLVRHGVSRILPKPVDAAALQRLLRHTTLPGAPSPALPAQFRKLTPAQLIEVVTAEARRAFDAGGPAQRAGAAIDFGSGAEVLAALWAAFARIRTLATTASEGAVRFPLQGPGGAIPIAPVALRAQRTDSAVVSRELAGRQFVIVDHDLASLRVLARSLERLGALVLPARDAAQALTLAQQHWPDAVISDTLMLGLDGFELCRRIHEDIALADLPVLLLSWKDQLLECARSLGDARATGADLDPASLAAPLRDCLLARTALERRLSEAGDVHGRLDGITPRLLLQLVCSERRDARLTLRSGRLRFELAVHEGRPVHALLLDDAARVAEGQDVLGPFLGIRVGRFSVQQSSAPTPGQLQGDLSQLLAPAITRARRARDWFSSGNLDAIERVSLDASAAGHYAADAAAIERTVLAQLSAGSPPRGLGASRERGGADAHVIGTLLELARRGAILALLDRDGRDLLASEAVPAAPAPDAPAVPPRSLPASTPREQAPRAQEHVPSISLGDAVLQAVSAPPPLESETELAPLPTNSARPPLPIQHSTRHALHPDTAPSRARREPRELTEPWTIREEADPELASDAEPAAESDADPIAATDDVDPWPTTRGSRLRAAAAPALLSLSAAAIAFVAIRGVAGDNWSTLSASLLGAPTRLDAGGARTEQQVRAPRPVAPALPEAQPALTAAPPESSDVLAEQRRVPFNVSFESELLDLPPHSKLPYGHGLLEVRTWERQQIYVDGVFMGNYENRLVPLVPGNYQLRLHDGGRDMERAVQIEAGRRTRVVARPKSAQ